MPTEKTDAQTVYPNLKSSRGPERIAPKREVPLAPGLTSDAKRGSTSPLGGQAKPAERPKR
jgi:hypothetical protein